MSAFGFSFGRSNGCNILPDVSDRLEDYFVLEEQKLGKGHFGVVRACIDRSTGERLACKSISKARLRYWEDRDDVRREVAVMRCLGRHDQLVGLRAAFEDRHHVHLVLDLCRGGELFDAIGRRGPLPECLAARALRDIASAVAHCHARGVLHRDLKPENILLVREGAGAEDDCEEDNLQLKVADFGLSLMVREGESVRGLAGSPYYLAPEVLAGSYGHKADVWSMGVILYMMLSESVPFFGHDDATILENIARCELRFDCAAWAGVSEEAKELVRVMLRRDPAQRPTAAEVLQHPWVLKHSAAAVAKGEGRSRCSSSGSNGGALSHKGRRSDCSVGATAEAGVAAAGVVRAGSSPAAAPCCSALTAPASVEAPTHVGPTSSSPARLGPGVEPDIPALLACHSAGEEEEQAPQRQREPLDWVMIACQPFLACQAPRHGTVGSGADLTADVVGSESSGLEWLLGF